MQFQIDPKSEQSEQESSKDKLRREKREQLLREALDREQSINNPLLREAHGLKVIKEQNYPGDETQKINPSQLNKSLLFFSHSLVQTELYFGFNEGKLIRTIRVLPDRNIKDSAAPGSSSLLISYGVLEEPEQHLILISKHELAHQMDRSLDWYLSGMELARIHGKIVEEGTVSKRSAQEEAKLGGKRVADFFYELNENRFFKEVTSYGGHTQDNARELLASLVCSLYGISESRRWLEKINSRSPEFQQYYRLCINALASNIEFFQKRGNLPKEFGLARDVRLAQDLLSK